MKLAPNADLRSLRRKERPPQRPGTPEGADPCSLRIKSYLHIFSKHNKKQTRIWATCAAKRGPRTPESARRAPKELQKEAPGKSRWNQNSIEIWGLIKWQPAMYLRSLRRKERHQELQQQNNTIRVLLVSSRRDESKRNKSLYFFSQIDRMWFSPPNNNILLREHKIQHHKLRTERAFILGTLTSIVLYNRLYI